MTAREYSADDKSEEGQNRAANIEELLNSVAQYEEDGKDKVPLMTAHASKGLEEFLFPSKNAEDESEHHGDRGGEGEPARLDAGLLPDSHGALRPKAAAPSHPSPREATKK